MADAADTVFLFDVDNTLLNNDEVQADLKTYLSLHHGVEACKRYWEIFEQLRAELGYANYLGALDRYRLERLHDPCLLHMANWLVDYPFQQRLFPGALDAIEHVQRFGRPVVLSDGDAVFEPRKVARSGLWRAFDGRVLIYVHKEQELDDVERWHPARHYVMIDDKLRLLAAIKQAWGDKVTTVFVRQGHYATDAAAIAHLPRADVEIEAIGDLVLRDWSKRAA